MRFSVQDGALNQLSVPLQALPFPPQQLLLLLRHLHLRGVLLVLVLQVEKGARGHNLDQVMLPHKLLHQALHSKHPMEL